MRTIKARRVIFGAAVATVMLIGITSGVASANPQATEPIATLSCDGGPDIYVFGVPNSGFLDHSPVGIIGGKGVVARWFEGTGSETIVIDGDDTSPHVSVGGFEGPAGTESRRNPRPDLSRLTRCTSPEPEYYSFSGEVDEYLLEYLGIEDPSLIGADFTVEGEFSLTVYLNQVQLSHR